MKTLIGIVVLIVVVAGGFFLFQGSEPTETGPLTIGFIGPLSGDVANLGEPVRDAVALAVTEINEAGGVDGRELRVIYEDGACNAKGGTNAAQKLINVDGVKFIVGGLCSGETLGAAPFAEELGVILFSPGSGSPDITNAGDYIFRNFPSDATSGSKMAETAIENGWTNVGLLIEVTGYAQALKGVFVDRFEELGGTIVTDESFTTEASDVRNQIAKLKAADLDAVYFVAQTPTTAEIGLRQIGELDLDVPLLSNEFLNTASILETVPEIVEGALYAEPSFDPEASQSAAYLEKHKEVYGSLGDVLPPIYLATGYDAVYILTELIAKNNGDVEDVKRDLYRIRDREGAAGVLTIDENGDPLFEYVVKTIRGGEVVEVE